MGSNKVAYVPGRDPGPTTGYHTNSSSSHMWRAEFCSMEASHRSFQSSQASTSLVPLFPQISSSWSVPLDSCDNNPNRTFIFENSLMPPLSQSNFSQRLRSETWLSCHHVLISPRINFQVNRNNSLCENLISHNSENILLISHDHLLDN